DPTPPHTRRCDQRISPSSLTHSTKPAGHRPGPGFWIGTGQRTTGLAQQSADEQATAHADASMDLPYRKVHPELTERLLPRENVLVNTVDQRSVKVEQHTRRIRRG